MNVVFINQFSLDYLGGVELHILNLGKELLRQGAKLTLVCREAGEKQRWQRPVEGFRIVHAPNLRALGAFLHGEARQIDVCHAHMARKPYALCGLLFARLLGIPTVFTPHCFYPGSNIIKKFTKRTYDETLTRLTFRTSDRVINLTPVDQKDSLQRGMSLAKSRIIPNSICVSQLQNLQPVAFRKKYGISREYLLHVGRFQRQKCIDFMVRGQTLLDGISLVLIGQDDGELEPIRRTINELGLSHRVHILEKIPFEDVCSAYREAVALVMASRNEGLPTVILEAAVFGTQTIAPRVGGIPYIVQEGRTGYLYNWGDIQGYVACVRSLLAGQRRMNDSSRDELLSQFCWEHNADKVASVYREILPREKGSGQSKEFISYSQLGGGAR
jgi:glycosyltransferase involved in cell wall biosynthesis